MDQLPAARPRRVRQHPGARVRRGGGGPPAPRLRRHRHPAQERQGPHQTCRLHHEHLNVG